MATCKDCLHYEPCYEYGNILDPIHGGVKCDSFKPTADVVPKSEVEELKAIIADHKANEERLEELYSNAKAEVEKETKNWQELYADTVSKWEKAYEELEIKLENAKAEVAREIFEEIKRIGGVNNGAFLYNTEIAELKKKYKEV
jgi:uncharacterized protein YukE